MPLDTSIPLQVRPAQFDDPMAIRAKGLQLRQLETADAEQRRVAGERQTIRDLYRSSVGEDGSIDSRQLSRGVAQAGLGDQIPDIQKGLADSRAAVTKADDGDLNLHKKRLDTLNGGLSALLANPNVTQQDVIAQINTFVQAGIITPQQGAEAARKIPGRPEQLRPFLVQRALEAADASKQLEAILPQYNEQDRGGVINEGTVDKLTGQRTPGTDVAKTNTPGELLSANTSRELAQAGYSVQKDANGALILVPTKPGAGAVVPRPVTDGNGKPVMGDPLNEAQSKSLTFGSRARDSAAIMEKLAQGGTLTPSVTKQAAERVPLIGGVLAAGANATLASAEEQQLEQAQRDFVNAVLRKESGAVISPEEFNNASKQYFPSIGDNDAVIEQKRRNRETAVEGLLSGVPEGYRSTIGAAAQRPPAAAALPTGSAPASPRKGPRPPLNAFVRPK